MSETRIVEGWRPGALGFIIGEHGRYYSRHWGFGAYFEARVAAELASFAGRADETADRFFFALDAEERILGALVIDAHDPDSRDVEAHLRWFILSDAARGKGVGQSLMQAAMAHVDRLGLGCWLTTFAGLDAARHLYEKAGFILQSECEGQSWGVRVMEQLFRRPSKN